MRRRIVVWLDLLARIVQAGQKERRWLTRENESQLEYLLSGGAWGPTKSGTRLMQGTNLAPSLISTPELGPTCISQVHDQTKRLQGPP